MNLHDEIRKILIDEKKTFKWLGDQLNVGGPNLSRQIKQEKVPYSRLSKVLALLGKKLTIEPVEPQ